MKKIFVLLSCLLMSCSSQGSTPSQEKDQNTAEKQQSIYTLKQPVPMFDWSQDRDNLIQIYKMKQESRVTFSVVRSNGTGEILWSCPSIGFPLAAGTQLTNPKQIQVLNGYSRYVDGVIEQPEPNGLYSDPNTDGTYVICVLPNGDLSPQYSEGKVETFSRPAKVENGKVVFLDGDSSMKIERHNN